MYIMDIKDMIGETTEYDKKLALEERRPKSWCKSVSAFANTFGGALIFGISDDNEIVGLENPEKDAEKVSEIIKSRLNPIPEFNLRFYKTEGGKVLLILDIFKGDETPYYYSADGVLEAYVRIGRFRKGIYCQCRQQEEIRFWLMCLTGLVTWSEKGAGLKK